MRIKAILISNLKSIRIMWKQVLLMYIIFPVILCAAMGYFQKDEYRPTTKINKINIQVVDKDNTNSSKQFVEFLKSDSLKELFNIKQKADYVLIIPEGYENNLVNLKKDTITVNEKKRDSGYDDYIIKELIKEYGLQLTQVSTISKNITNMSVNDKEKLFNEVIGDINSISQKRALKGNIVKAKRTLTSYENEAASMMTYIVFMMILGFIASHYTDKENGSFKRIVSTPITRFQYFNLTLVSFFSVSFIYGLLYILSMRVSGMGFIGTNPILLTAVLIAQSIFITFISGFFVAFFKKNVANTIIVILMYAEIIFGGAFIPQKAIANGAFIPYLKFTIGNMFTQAYKNCIIFNSFSKVYIYLVVMIAVSALLYVLSAVRVKIGWEE